MNAQSIEQRAARGIESRFTPAGSPYIAKIIGYAAVFNVDSEERLSPGMQRPYVERLAKGAFKRSLEGEAAGEIMGLLDGSDESPFARLGVNMALVEDAHGLRVAIDLPDNERSRDLLTNIQHGIVDAMAFSFRVRPRGERWERGEARDVRVLTDIDLQSVGPVIWPAYPAAKVAEARHGRFVSHCEAYPETRAWTPFGEEGEYRALDYWLARGKLAEIGGGT